MYAFTPRALASMAAMAAACGYAGLKGGRTERRGAAAIAAGWALSPAVQLHPLHRLQWGVLALDAAVAGALLALALRSTRWWPMPAAALLLLILTEHIGYAVAPHDVSMAYFAGEEIWSYALLLVLAVGVAFEGDAALSPATSRDCARALRPPGTASP